MHIKNIYGGLSLNDSNLILILQIWMSCYLHIRDNQTQELRERARICCLSKSRQDDSSSNREMNGGRIAYRENEDSTENALKVSDFKACMTGLTAKNEKSQETDSLYRGNSRT